MGLGPSGELLARALIEADGTVHLVLDVNGYFK